MKSIVTCCLLFIVAGCFEVSEKVSSSQIQTPNNYLWKGVFPKSIYISRDYKNIFCETGDSAKMHDFCNGSDASSGVRVTALMADRWNELFVNYNFISLKETVPNDFKDIFTSIGEVNKDGYNGIYTLTDTQWTASGFKESTLGVTVLIGKTNENRQYIIQEGDILIGPSSEGYNLGTILLHEMGHFLGLQHNESVERTQTVMYPYIGSSDVKQTPMSVDKQSLNRLYMVSGSIGQDSRRREIPDGNGEEVRIVFELGADKNCRHLINGKLIETHKVDL